MHLFRGVKHYITRVLQSKLYYIKRKLGLLIAAIMIGLSNAVLSDNKMLNDIQNKIEHVQDINDNDDDKQKTIF